MSMTQSETFEWLRERSNRLAQIEAERDALRDKLKPGPCGHPMACWVEPVEAIPISDGTFVATLVGYCTICREIQQAERELSLHVPTAGAAGWIICKCGWKHERGEMSWDEQWTGHIRRAFSAAPTPTPRSQKEGGE